MCKVVYEDNHLLVVEKPPNLLVQGDATGDDCLVERMKRYVKEKYQKPGAVYLGLVHRMDRPVGGLVVLARTEKAASRLSQQLRNHQMGREYLAVVHGMALPDEEKLQNVLVKDEATGSVRVVEAGEGKQRDALPSGSQEARLRYRVLGRDAATDTALLHIQLETGRKHQIRVQLAHMGHPIVQDMRYGKDSPGEPIALWGAVLRLEHPTRKEKMTFVSPPQDKAFQRFGEAIHPFLQREQVENPFHFLPTQTNDSSKGDII